MNNNDFMLEGMYEDKVVMVNSFAQIPYNIKHRSPIINLEHNNDACIIGYDMKERIRYFFIKHDCKPNSRTPTEMEKTYLQNYYDNKDAKITNIGNIIHPLYYDANTICRYTNIITRQTDWAMVLHCIFGANNNFLRMYNYVNIGDMRYILVYLDTSLHYAVFLADSIYGDMPISQYDACGNSFEDTYLHSYLNTEFKSRIMQNVPVLSTCNLYITIPDINMINNCYAMTHRIDICDTRDPEIVEQVPYYRKYPAIVPISNPRVFNYTKSSIKPILSYWLSDKCDKVLKDGSDAKYFNTVWFKQYNKDGTRYYYNNIGKQKCTSTCGVRPVLIISK